MAAKNNFEFTAFGPFEWKGRYRRIYGDASVFHVIRHAGKWVISACIVNGDELIVCHALSSSAEQELIHAINSIKRRYGHQNGGSFLINEFGQVLVPVNKTLRFCVGQTSGVLLFKNLDTGAQVNPADDQGLEAGDRWDRPYVGMRYNLTAGGSRIYMGLGRAGMAEPPVQDRDLIRKLRKIRRHGAVRFIVNPYGLVLTKEPSGEFDFSEDKWEPVYVGRIDYTKWFEKEEPEWQISS